METNPPGEEDVNPSEAEEDTAPAGAGEWIASLFAPTFTAADIYNKDKPTAKEDKLFGELGIVGFSNDAYTKLYEKVILEEEHQLKAMQIAKARQRSLRRVRFTEENEQETLLPVDTHTKRKDKKNSQSDNSKQERAPTRTRPVEKSSTDTSLRHQQQLNEEGETFKFLYHQLEKKVVKLLSCIEMKTLKLKQQKSTMKTTKKEMEQDKKSLSHAVKKVAALQAKVDKLEQVVTRQEDEVQFLTEQYADTNAKAGALRIQNSELHKVAERQRLHIHSLTLKLAEVKEAHEMYVFRTDTEIKQAHESEVGGLIEQINSLQRKLDEQQEHCDLVEGTMATLQKHFNNQQRDQQHNQQHNQQPNQQHSQQRNLRYRLHNDETSAVMLINSSVDDHDDYGDGDDHDYGDDDGDVDYPTRDNAHPSNDDFRNDNHDVRNEHNNGSNDVSNDDVSRNDDVRHVLTFDNHHVHSTRHNLNFSKSHKESVFLNVVDL